MARIGLRKPVHVDKCKNCVCPRFVEKYDKILHRVLELKDKGVIDKKTMYYIMLVDNLGKEENHESD